VLPNSTTSGLSLLDSDVVSFSTMPVHCWRSNLTSTSGWILLNSAIAKLTSSSGVSPPLSQSRIDSLASPAGSVAAGSVAAGSVAVGSVAVVSAGAASSSPSSSPPARRAAGLRYWFGSRVGLLVAFGWWGSVDR
jgi:hypothetical protein